MGGKEDKKIKGQVPLLEQNATNSSGAVSTRRAPSRRSFWLCCFRPESEQVRELDYRHLSLQDVPTEIFNYERTLEELYLDCNQIVDLPRPLFHCHSLRRLNLSDNEIQAIPPAVASLIHLQELDVSKNSLGEFPDNIKCCKQLRLLDASVNPLCKLPEGATQLLCLEELYLSDTFLEFLPANFGRLNKLRILELRENQLSSLPKSMARLTSLTRLDIGQNDFNELPEVVGSLLVLEELWCDCNKLSNLPEFLGQLKKLTHLDASKNYLEELPASLNDCIALKDLSLSANNLSCLPVIHGLKSLVVLRLDDNRLTCLPDSLGLCSSLEELQVGQNRLKSLPPAIGLLRKLHALYVDENQLEQLPPEVGSCTALTVLSGRRNALMSIPAELGHLSKLRVLNLSGNRLLNLPVSLLNLPALLALWLSESQNKPLIPLQTEKDPGTGNKVLTCFLLPQTSSEPDWGNIAKGEDETEFLLDHWEEQRQARMQIKFASDGEPDLLDSKLARNPTPYPKELKALAKHAHNVASKHSTTHEGDKDRSSITGTSKDNKDVGSSEVASSVSAEETPNRRKEAINGSSPVVIKEAKQIAIPRVTEKVSELPSSVVPKPLGEVPVTTSSVVVEEEPRVPPPYHVAAAYSKHAEKFNQPESLASTPVTTEPVANFLPKSTASPVWEKSFTASLPASPSSHLLPINDVNTPLSTPTSTNITAPAVGMSNEQFLNSDQSESMTSESPSPGSQSPCEELDHVSLLANDRHSSPDSGRGQSEEPLTTSTELPPSSNISCTSINAIPVEKRSTYVIERNERKRNYNHSDETDDPNSADALRQAARMVLSASRPSSVAYQTPIITHDSPTVTNTLDAAHVLGLPSFAPIAASALAAATQHVNGYEPLKERVSRLPPPKVKLETKIPTTSTTSIPEMKREPSFVTSKIPSLGPKLPSSTASPITKEAKISRLPPPQIHAASPNQTYLPMGVDSSMTRSFPTSNTVLTSYQELTHKSYSSSSMPITTTTGVVSPASKIPPPKLERMSSTLSTVSVSSSRESRIPPPQVHATPPEPSRTLSASRLPAPSVKMPPTLTNMTSSSSSASATTTTSTSRLPVASYSKSRLVADSTSLARQTNLPSAWSKAERST